MPTNQGQEDAERLHEDDVRHVQEVGLGEELARIPGDTGG